MWIEPTSPTTEPTSSPTPSGSKSFVQYSDAERLVSIRFPFTVPLLYFDSFKIFATFWAINDWVTVTAFSLEYLYLPSVLVDKCAPFLRYLPCQLGYLALLNWSLTFPKMHGYWHRPDCDLYPCGYSPRKNYLCIRMLGHKKPFLFQTNHVHRVFGPYCPCLKRFRKDSLDLRLWLVLLIKQ